MDLNVEQLRHFFMTKQVNILLGSGTSKPSIPLMDEIQGESKERKNDNLLKEIINISKCLAKDDLNDNDEITLTNYIGFFQFLLNMLNKGNSRITPKSMNIFTTNYDFYIEKAFDYLFGCNNFIFNDGTSGYFNKYLDSSNFNQVVGYKGLNDNYISELPSINLVKLHGSVNWKQCKDKIIVKNNTVSKPVVVRPTGKEEEETFLNNHFHEMLRIMQLELDKPQSVLVVIGFSFQDTHIAKMLKRALKNNELLVYIFCFKDSDKDDILSNLSLTAELNNLCVVNPSMLDKLIDLKSYIDDEGIEHKIFTISDFERLLSLTKEDL